MIMGPGEKLTASPASLSGNDRNALGSAACAGEALRINAMAAAAAALLATFHTWPSSWPCDARATTAREDLATALLWAKRGWQEEDAKLFSTSVRRPVWTAGKEAKVVMDAMVSAEIVCPRKTNQFAWS